MHSTFPHLCTALVNRVSDFGWESRLGIHTTRSAPSPHPDAHRYGYLAFHTYLSILDSLELKPSNLVVDLGCGKGRVVCAAAQYAVREAIGVEIDPSLAAQAEANVARLRRRRASVRIDCCSATEFDFSTTTVIVMFHPFGAETMNQVLDRLQTSLTAHPRTLRMVYANPVLSSVVASRPWLTLDACRHTDGWSRVKFPVHFYRSLPI